MMAVLTIFLLKFCLPTMGAGLISSVLIDLYKKGMIQIPVKPAKKYIDVDAEGHMMVLGISGFGKTYATKKSLTRSKRAVLFFNTQDEDMPKGFVKADGYTPFSVIRKAISQKKKINYVPNTKRDVMQKELELVIDNLFDGVQRDLILVIDEVHLYKKDALNNIIRVFTAGRRWGIKGIAISQRPAAVDNFIYSQSTHKVIFAVDDVDLKYFKDTGTINPDEVRQRIGKQKYLYLEKKGLEVTGPYKVE